MWWTEGTERPTICQLQVIRLGKDLVRLHSSGALPLIVTCTLKLVGPSTITIPTARHTVECQTDHHGVADEEGFAETMMSARFTDGMPESNQIRVLCMYS